MFMYKWFTYIQYLFFSSPLASAVHLYLRHSGIKLRDSKVFPGLISEKEKWLPFFPKTLKVRNNHSVI